MIHTKILKTLKNDKGAAYIDSAVKLIIAVILAAILLFGFFAILKSSVLPGIQAHVDQNVNGGQVQAMTNIGKTYAKWKNDLTDEILGDIEAYETAEEIRLVYAITNGLITAEDFEDEDVLYSKLPDRVEIPENDPGITIYWYYAAIQYIDGNDTTLMTKEEFNDFERTDEGKHSIMETIGS